MPKRMACQHTDYSFDWIASGVISPESDFITRAAPASLEGVGGGSFDVVTVQGTWKWEAGSDDTKVDMFTGV
jgi:hypothetical protein